MDSIHHYIIARVGSYSINIWNLKEKKIEKKIIEKDKYGSNIYVNCVCFSNDGLHIAAPIFSIP